MKLFLLCAFVACASGTEPQKKPSFTWLHDRTSSSGVPLLEINFPDYGEVDYALLEPYNPIPKRSYERAEDVDNCIFQGKLKNEADVHVTVTGGCPRDEIFEIQFRSKRLSDHLFRMENGEVEILKSPLSERSLEFMIQDMAVGDLEEFQEKADVADRIPLPPTLVMNIGAHYEQTFKSRFGTDSVNTMRRVIAQVQNIYYWPSLTTRIRLNVVFERELNMILEANVSNLTSALTVGTDPTVNSNVIFCSQNNQYGTVGIGWLGTACSSNLGYRSNIDEYFFTDSQTAQIVAHEMGHNLNMDHDFTATGGPRFDSQNRTCTNIGGIMDYNQATYSVWSTCSVEDFTRYYNQFTSFCMPQDTGSTSSTPYMPTTTTSYTPPTFTSPGPDGNWGDWTDYSPCSVTCGSGQIVRWRQCNSPPPQPNGQPCAGCNAAYFACNMPSCSTNITLTLEVQDAVTRVFLRPATLNINGQSRSAPAVFPNVLNGTNYNVGASSPGYYDAPARPMTALAIGAVALGGPLQYLFLTVPTLPPNQLAVVLGWGPGVYDMDLHIIQFELSNPASYCHLYYGSRTCNSSYYVSDWLNTGANGGEVALLSNSTSFVYGVFVRTTGVVISQASISVFGIPTPLTGLPSGQGLETYWIFGCINGATQRVAFMDSATYNDPTTTLAGTCARQFS